MHHLMIINKTLESCTISKLEDCASETILIIQLKLLILVPTDILTSL
jgi:hypothetical protein